MKQTVKFYLKCCRTQKLKINNYNQFRRRKKKFCFLLSRNFWWTLASNSSTSVCYSSN